MIDIKEARRNLDNMTQSKLAVKVGVSLTTIQLWERGVSRPTPENLAKLTAALQLDK